MEDYYKILGVSIHANNSEIKSQFKTLVKKYHPDHNSAENAAEYFRNVHRAYEVLSSDFEREKYNKVYFNFLEEEKKKKKEKIKLGVKRILTIIFSFLFGFLVHFLIGKYGNFGNIEKYLTVFSSGFLSYFIILLLIFNFSGFFTSQKQTKIWRFHTIIGIFSFLIIFFQVFSLLLKSLEPMQGGFFFSISSLVLILIFKTIFFTQESFLQIKKGNFDFVLKHFVEVLFTGILVFIISNFLGFMLYNSMSMPTNLSLILILGLFGSSIAVLFSSFNED